MNRSAGRLAACSLITSFLLAASPLEAQEQVRKLLPLEPAEGDAFGAAVAVSEGVAIVGAPGDDDVRYAGSVSFFDLATGELLFKDFGEDGLGRSLAFSEGIALVAQNAARAVRSYDVSTGTLLAELYGSDTFSNDQFGCSMAISDTVAIVGAFDDDDNGSTSGSAFVFDAGTGEQLFKLHPDDAAAGDQFGYSVSIDGSIAVVGAPKAFRNGARSGTVYAFDTTSGAQLMRYLPEDPEWDWYFGWSIAVDGNRLLVGARGDDTNGTRSGSAYLFDVTTGEQLMKVIPGDNEAEDAFGQSVDMSGNLLLIGAPGSDDSGAAYVFDATSGTQLAKLQASDGVAGDHFSYSLSLSGTTAVVGAYSDDNNMGVDAGAAYVFSLDPLVTATPPATKRSVQLHPNVPNPFNPTTRIVFDLPEPSSVRLEIVDVAGRLVMTLVDEWRSAERHEVIWNGTDSHGSSVSTGVYLCRLVTDAGTVSRSMVLLR